MSAVKERGVLSMRKRGGLLQMRTLKLFLQQTEDFMKIMKYGQGGRGVEAVRTRERFKFFCSFVRTFFQARSQEFVMGGGKILRGSGGRAPSRRR